LLKVTSNSREFPSRLPEILPLPVNPVNGVRSPEYSLPLLSLPQEITNKEATTTKIEHFNIYI